LGYGFAMDRIGNCRNLLGKMFFDILVALASMVKNGFKE
jgi:hypothetical protein